MSTTILRGRDGLRATWDGTTVYLYHPTRGYVCGGYADTDATAKTMAARLARRFRRHPEEYLQ